MGLRDVVASGIATAHRITGGTGGLQATVTHKPYASQSGWQKPTAGTSVPRTGILQYDTKRVVNDAGQEVVSSAQLLFLFAVSVDLKDRFTLPDGTEPPIVHVSGPADPATAGRYLTIVYFGDAGGNR